MSNDVLRRCFGGLRSESECSEGHGVDVLVQAVIIIIIIVIVSSNN